MNTEPEPTNNVVSVGNSTLTFAYSILLVVVLSNFNCNKAVLVPGVANVIDDSEDKYVLLLIAVLNALTIALGACEPAVNPRFNVNSNSVGVAVSLLYSAGPVYCLIVII